MRRILFSCILLLWWHIKNLLEVPIVCLPTAAASKNIVTSQYFYHESSNMWCFLQSLKTLKIPLFFFFFWHMRNEKLENTVLQGSETPNTFIPKLIAFFNLLRSQGPYRKVDKVKAVHNAHYFTPVFCPSPIIPGNGFSMPFRSLRILLVWIRSLSWSSCMKP